MEKKLYKPPQNLAEDPIVPGRTIRGFPTTRPNRRHPSDYVSKMYVAKATMPRPPANGPQTPLHPTTSLVFFLYSRTTTTAIHRFHMPNPSKRSSKAAPCLRRRALCSLQCLLLESRLLESRLLGSLILAALSSSNPLLTSPNTSAPPSLRPLHPHPEWRRKTRCQPRRESLT
jgi:hypothetical protein